jgi:hypothetical protein
MERLRAPSSLYCKRDLRREQTRLRAKIRFAEPIMLQYGYKGRERVFPTHAAAHFTDPIHTARAFNPRGLKAFFYFCAWQTLFEGVIIL